MGKDKEGYSNRLLLLFLVIFGVLIIELGLNNDKLLVEENQITGLQTLNIQDSFRNALKLFGDVLNPLFEAIGEDKNAVFLRLIYWLFLFFIISGFEGLRKRFGADETGVKRANIIAGIIALIAVMFTPVEFLLLIGNSVFLFVFIGLVLGGLYFIYNFGRGEENRFTYFIKAFLSLILVLLISASSSYATTKFGSSIGIGDLFGIIAGFATAIAIIFFFWYLFIKTLAGGPTEEIEGLPPSKQLRGAGGFWGRLFGGAAKATGKGIYKGGKWVKGKIRPTPEQKIENYQKAIIKELKKDINYATKMATIFLKNPKNDSNFNAFINSINIILNKPVGGGISYNRLKRMTLILNNYYKSGVKTPDENLFYRRVVSLTQATLQELLSILRSLK